MKVNFLLVVRTSRVRIRVYYEHTNKCLSSVTATNDFIKRFLSSVRENNEYKAFLHSHGREYNQWLSVGTEARRKMFEAWKIKSNSR